jgi:hypothetical protein
MRVRRRSRQVVLTAVFLLLEAVALALAVYATVRPIDFQREFTRATPSLASAQALTAVALLTPVVGVTLVSALVVIALPRLGWHCAMLVQIFALWWALSLYGAWRPPAIYPIMLVAILMVLYLNSAAVRQVFQPRTAHPVHAVPEVDSEH